MCDHVFYGGAGVACRALNSSWGGGITTYGAPYGQGQGPVLLKFLVCTGEERSLLECAPDTRFSDDECMHTSDIGLVCLPEGSPQRAPARAAVCCRMPAQAVLCQCRC